MQGLEQLPRIPLLRTRVNKGLERGQHGAPKPTSSTGSGWPPGCMGGPQSPRTTPGIGQATPASGASLATLAALLGSPTPSKRGISLDLHYSEPTRRTQPLGRYSTSTRQR